MTLNDTKKLLMTIESMYPTFKVDNPRETAAAWHWALENYPTEAVMAALQIYINTNNTGFAPSVAQLIGCMHSTQANKIMTEGEAWVLVKKAISDGGYHAEERYKELPPLVQRAVGGPEMIHQWAQTASDEVNTVIMSNFQRTYRAVVSKADFERKVSPQMAQIVQDVCARLEDKNV